MTNAIQLSSLVRKAKPWMIAAPTWKALVSPALTSETILRELGCSGDHAVVVAKPSENLYIGKPICGLDSVSAAIANLAGHGEMAIASVYSSQPLSLTARSIVDLLPSKPQVVVAGKDSEKIGEKRGKLLNHSGYRKVVMNLVPNTLADHAWVACALSYRLPSPSDPQIEGFMFDPVGGSIAGGIAGITRDGCVFRGSGIADPTKTLVSPEQSFAVSAAANAVATADIVDTAECISHEDFVRHPFFQKLRTMIDNQSTA